MKGGWFWHELNTPDGTRAKQFYEALLGWGAADMPMPTGMYTVFQHGGTGHGGMIQTGSAGLEDVPTMWLTYIETDNVDGDHRRVGDLGGKAITHVMEVPNVGRWFLAEDPTGAQFALMQPFPQAPVTAPAPPKAKKAGAKKKPAARKPAKGKTAAKRAKALVPKVAKAKAAAAKPPAKSASKKAHPRSAALKATKRQKGQRPGKMAARDTAAAKSRSASLKGRSQLNFRR